MFQLLPIGFDLVTIKQRILYTYNDQNIQMNNSSEINGIKIVNTNYQNSKQYKISFK